MGIDPVVVACSDTSGRAMMVYAATTISTAEAKVNPRVA
jgi:hypothetical protein